MTNASSLSLGQLKRAVQIKEQMTKLESQLATLLGATPAPAAKPTGNGMSAATRAKLSAMGKARWAKIKAGNRPSPKASVAQKAASSKTATPARKPMTAAQRAKIAATLKARWAKIKAARAH